MESHILLRYREIDVFYYFSIHERLRYEEPRPTPLTLGALTGLGVP